MIAQKQRIFVEHLERAVICPLSLVIRKDYPASISIKGAKEPTFARLGGQIPVVLEP
jgi:hypothetical protein